MSTQNASDLIEAYLRKLLKEVEEIEIRRSELANRFDVVPSQINYVINTRFKPINGFDVESKRGGGGYIRIVKFHYSGQHELLSEIFTHVPAIFSVSELQSTLQLLFSEGILSQRETKFILSILAADELSGAMRSKLFKKLLDKLDRE